MCAACRPREFGVGWLVRARAWEHVSAYFRVEQHSRTEEESEGYFRLELEAPWRVARVLLNLEADCVACRASVRAFRLRQGGGGIYYASTCPLDQNVGCCRTAAARADHAALVAALGGGPKASALQPGLPGFDGV